MDFERINLRLMSKINPDPLNGDEPYAAVIIGRKRGAPRHEGDQPSEGVPVIEDAIGGTDETTKTSGGGD
jgi:hypothetical protein